jgi:acyl-CoA synthetase (AMP-forming)/AMP-acid ligase II
MVQPDRLALGPDAWVRGLGQPHRASPGTPAFLQYTSGSTADPKGVVVSYGNLVHNEEMIRQAFEQTEMLKARSMSGAERVEKLRAHRPHSGELRPIVR